mmetsp:Transcript_11998/g.31755  ORF Transcript_11998/g.31755 Transcript_11998/m.31755 type:complete len:326 (-) Transcript_11998:3239-4216(-)
MLPWRTAFRTCVSVDASRRIPATTTTTTTNTRVKTTPTPTTSFKTMQMAGHRLTMICKNKMASRPQRHPNVYIIVRTLRRHKRAASSSSVAKLQPRKTPQPQPRKIPRTAQRLEERCTCVALEGEMEVWREATAMGTMIRLSEMERGVVFLMMMEFRRRNSRRRIRMTTMKTTTTTTTKTMWRMATRVTMMSTTTRTTEFLWATDERAQTASSTGRRLATKTVRRRHVLGVDRTPTMSLCLMVSTASHSPGAAAVTRRTIRSSPVSCAVEARRAWVIAERGARVRPSQVSRRIQVRREAGAAKTRRRCSSNLAGERCLACLLHER